MKNVKPILLCIFCKITIYPGIAIKVIYLTISIITY